MLVHIETTSGGIFIETNDVMDLGYMVDEELNDEFLELHYLYKSNPTEEFKRIVTKKTIEDLISKLEKLV